MDNYRGISIGSNLGKCFMRVVQERLQEKVEQDNTLGEIQNAFRKDRRGTDSIFTLVGLIEISKLRKDDLFLAFVDLRKAFDRVWREGLWERLVRAGFDEEEVSLFENTYRDMRKCVLINSEYIEWFDSKIGVR